MSLNAGTKLGRYEIRSKLGEGGMGEVYLALDIELNRTVALKILPEHLASNEQRLRRFIQEAQAASALNHPHILTIHEVGNTANTRFIVTEFIDGETLRQRIVAGSMRLTDILEVAIQSASALAAAHAAGIIHRDIKPENIMVRRDGYVKVLDFGLAKLTEPSSSILDSDAPTKALVNTRDGVVMGTASYMSPEQAKGIDLDARTDLWSLGVVLYEMIVGRGPFVGTLSHVLQMAQQLPQLSVLTMNLVAEGHAIDELHGNVVVAVVIADFKDLRDVRMTQRCGRLRFLKEASHSILIRSEFCRKNLQGDFAIKFRVLCQIHLAHSAFTDFGDDAVMGKGCVGWKVAVHLFLSARSEISGFKLPPVLASIKVAARIKYEPVGAELPDFEPADSQRAAGPTRTHVGTGQRPVIDGAIFFQVQVIHHDLHVRESRHESHGHLCDRLAADCRCIVIDA